MFRDFIYLDINRVQSIIAQLQEGFALHAGIDRTYMSGIERGKRNVSLRSLLLISAALQMKVSELIAEAEEIATLQNEA